MITVNANTAASLTKVRNVKVEEADNAGKNWVGIRHRDLLDHFGQCLNGLGWGIKEDRFSLSSEDADMVASFDVKIPNLKFSKGTLPSIVLRNSNSRKRALGMYVGYKFGEVGVPLFYVPLAKRHTSGVDLESIMVGASIDLVTKIEELEEVRDAMETMTLSVMEVEHILMRAGRNTLLPWHLIGLADQYHEAFDNDQSESWNLLFSFARAVTKWNVPFYQMERIHKFGMMLPEYPKVENTNVVEA